MTVGGELAEFTLSAAEGVGVTLWVSIPHCDRDIVIVTRCYGFFASQGWGWPGTLTRIE